MATKRWCLSHTIFVKFDMRAVNCDHHQDKFRLTKDVAVLILALKFISPEINLYIDIGEVVAAG